MRHFITAIFIILSTLSFGQSKTIEVRGIVFEDTNGNGVRDKSEKLLIGVPVSNGEDIVLSNKKGEYLFHAEAGASIFAIPSSDYKSSSRIKNLNANFLYLDSVSYYNKTSIIHDIALNKQAEASKFAIGAIGDIQMKDYQEINYANQSILSELMLRKDIDFNIFLGDQINENISLFPFVEQMIENLPMPSWSILGNHDRYTDGSTHQDKEFNRYFGASHYAFNYGKIHFIVLNNVYSKDNNRNYAGYTTDEQLNFITNDLKYVPKENTIVLCQHIPMVYTRNKDSILKLLENRGKVLILSGHTHQVGRYVFSENIQELTAGATCGNWWVGERDWLGIPTALMQCGTPRGYFTVDFNQNNYKFQFKGIGLDKDSQMDIWINGQDSIDQYVEDLKNLDKNLIVANIYGASDSTRVLMQIDNGSWVEMEQSRMVAPGVSRVISLNKDDAYPSKHSRRGALRKRESPHIWTSKILEDLHEGIHSIRIKANDDWGFEAEGARLFIWQK